MTIRTDPGIILRVIRDGRHTQASLARELGLSETSVRLWKERGIPDHWLPRIANALGIACHELQTRLRYG